MKSIRLLSMALVLGLASVQGACSKDEAKETTGEQNQYVDDLYAAIKVVERDLSQGYLLRSATDRERQSFSDILYDIKIATQRLKKNPNDAQALSALYLASQSYSTLSILEVDGSQLNGLKNKLFETIDVVARMQGKTLENIERVLYEKLFTYELAPFTTVTDVGSKGWYKANHEDLSYSFVSSSKTSSWLFTPTMDLTNVVNPSFKVSQAISNRSNSFEGSIFFLVSEDYTGGDPNASTWEVAKVERLPDGSGFTVVDSENVSLKRYEGKKIVLAFHYDTRAAANYPIWQINSFELLGSGTFASTPLTLTGAGGGSGTGTGGANNGGAVANASNKATVCAGASAQNLFDFQFGKDFSADFTVVDSAKAITMVPAGYPGIARLSGYNPDTKANNVGTAWIVSKPINLSSTKDACVAVAEDIYLGKGASVDDYSKVQIVVSTDYSGDVNTATWKPIPLKNRKAQTGLVNKTAFATAASAVSIKSLVGDGAAKVTIAFKYVVDSADSAGSPAPWWGIGGLTVAAVPTGAGPVVVTATTPTDTTPTAPVVVPTIPFALTTVANNSWESTCYRFGDKGDYSKKYWSFSADTMTSLLLKYSDADCKVISTTPGADGKPRVWSTWMIGTLAATTLTENWAVVTGTCVSGCTGAITTAMRADAALLNEGSKINNSTPVAYNTAEGKYVAFKKAKSFLNLDELAASLNAAAPVPVAPTQPVVTQPTAAPVPEPVTATPVPEAPAPVTPSPTPAPSPIPAA
ncbi:MAG: hypothetical protein H7318_13135 [Oligoflexus sp.]|nr:hypothetical protein [Oligoflexus sp.]